MYSQKYSFLILILSFIMSHSLFSQSNCTVPLETIKDDSDREIVYPDFPWSTPDNDYDPPTDPGDRLVYFVHGLGGAAKDWDTPATDLQLNYKLTKLTDFSWESNGDFQRAGIDIIQQTVEKWHYWGEQNQLEDPLHNFIVASSMGSMVIRSADKSLAVDPDDGHPESDRVFGGLVAFSGSHTGFPLIDSRKNGTLDLWINRACRELAIGPVTEKIEVDIWLDILASLVLGDNTIAAALDNSCEQLTEVILPGLIGFLPGDFASNITNDNINTAVLGGLNSYESATRKVAFAGAEEDPVFFRLLYSLGNDQNDFPAWEAGADLQGLNDPDQAGAAAFNNLLNQYLSKVVTYSILYDLLDFPITNAVANFCQTPIGAIFPSEPCALYDLDALNIPNVNQEEAAAIRNAYVKGANWLVDADDEWKSIIGALEVEVIDTGEPTCSCLTEPDVIISEEELANCSGPTCIMGTVHEIEIVEKPSDGVVVAEAGLALPGSPQTDLMEKSNHMQLKNDYNAMVRWRDLLKGDYGIFFSTDER